MGTGKPCCPCKQYGIEFSGCPCGCHIPPPPASDDEALRVFRTAGQGVARIRVRLDRLVRQRPDLAAALARDLSDLEHIGKSLGVQERKAARAVREAEAETETEVAS